MMKLNFETDDEKAKWPGILFALGISAIIAFFIAFPDETMSFLKHGKELIASKESGKLGQDNKNNMCNGVFWNCTASPTVVQKASPEQRTEPVAVAARKVAPPPSAPVVDKFRNGKPLYFASREKKLISPLNDALAESNAPIYRWIGPMEDLSLLGIERFKPSIGLCALKMYLSCYMPKHFGRETIVRETDD